jgi:hypothetical protein
MKIAPTLDSINIKGPSALENFAKMLRKFWENLSTVVNGQISFGNIAPLQGAPGTIHCDNMDAVFVKLIVATANVDVSVTHNLGRLPVGYWLVRSSVACNVYDGSASSTNTTISLRFSATGTFLLVIV